ncbi:MAG: hypothetical protein HS116_22515 [Planctomycetes bacterium]|nr:hypothetical protein [Planctomycetota bacterium]
MNHRLGVLTLVSLLVLCPPTSIAGEDDWIHKGVAPSFLEIYLKKFPPKLSEKAIVVSPMVLKDDPSFKPIGMKDLPEFSDDIEAKVTKSGKVHLNGLVSTINYEEFKAREAEGGQKIVLPKELTGFKKDISARLYLQPGRAPLAIPLLGFGMLAESKAAQTYQADLYHAGNHVLCTDSIVTNGMNDATGLGVAGNAIAEAATTGKLIDSFLSMKDPKTGAFYRQRVSSVRLLGTSWGGIISMHVLRLPQAAQWPIDRALIVSIPLDLRETSQVLDKYHREDRNRTGILQLAKLAGGYTPRRDQPDEQECCWMRAGVGYVFHGDLALLAQNNIKRYSPELMERFEAFERDAEVQQIRKELEEQRKSRHDTEKRSLEERKSKLGDKEYDRLKDELSEAQKSENDYAQRKLSDLRDWSFKHYVFLLARPYWALDGDIADIGRLSVLLQGAPNFVQVVVAEDDPLNSPAVLNDIKSRYSAPQLLLLPHGGHLGFNGTKWFQAMAGKFFAFKP